MTRQLSCPSTDTGWQDMFLTALRQTGNVSAAARAAGVARSRCYEVRRRDPDFATGWQDALEEAADWLEFEALRRAVEGTEEDRFFGGHIVGLVTRYSDALLMFLLKARRPAQFAIRTGGRPTEDHATDTAAGRRSDGIPGGYPGQPPGQPSGQPSDQSSDRQFVAELRRRMEIVSGQRGSDAD